MRRQWIVCILRYFDFWGFCTEFQTTKRYGEFYSLILVFHILLILFTGWTFILTLKKHTDDSLGNINNALKLGSMLFVYLLSVIESFVKRPQQRQFWIIFQKVQKKFHSNESFQLRKYFLKFAYFITTSMISTVYFLYYLHKHNLVTADGWYFFLTFDIVTKIYQNRVMYYLFSLELIKIELNIIIRLATKAVKFSRIRIKTVIYRRNCRIMNYDETVNEISKYYQLTRQMSENINHVFGWSNSVTILFAFGFILTELNTVYWRWYNEGEIIKMLGL